MEDQKEFVVRILHMSEENGEPLPSVEMEILALGKEMYLQEIAFLKEITGWFSPNPDECPTVFPLDDDQFDSYLAFKRKLIEESKQ